jgi:hypothetical protein
MIKSLEQLFVVFATVFNSLVKQLSNKPHIVLIHALQLLSTSSEGLTIVFFD